VIPNGVVILRNGKIESVGKLGSVEIPGGATINDCTGMVVTAGFQNSHVHFIEPKWNHAGTQPATRLSAQLMTTSTIYGFTMVVDTGTIFDNTSKRRARIESGGVIGPRIITPVATLFPPNALLISRTQSPYFPDPSSFPMRLSIPMQRQHLAACSKSPYPQWSAPILPSSPNFHLRSTADTALQIFHQLRGLQVSVSAAAKLS